MSRSDRIHLDGDTIRYRSASGDWDLPVADVRVLGEATTPSGPFADDYFFCFASGPGMWLEASFYAEGRDELLRALEAKLGGPLEAGMASSTDFASRVLWPSALAGQPMFQYSGAPPEGFLEKLAGAARNRQAYSDAVAAFLEEKA